jgi:hypothetical protein
VLRVVAKTGRHGEPPGISGVAVRRQSVVFALQGLLERLEDWNEIVSSLRCGRPALHARTCPRAGQRRRQYLVPIPTPWVWRCWLADIRSEDVVTSRFRRRAAGHHGDKRFGARGVGVGWAELVEMARIGAKHEGVGSRRRAGRPVRNHIREASVVMLYLLPRFVTRLSRNAPSCPARASPHDYRAVAARQGAFDGRTRRR